MPMPVRWSAGARASIISMIQAKWSREEIEREVGYPWAYIVKRLAYHARNDALAAKRYHDPNYRHLALPLVDLPEEPDDPQAETRALQNLNRPRASIPQAIIDSAARRKAYG